AVGTLCPHPQARRLEHHMRGVHRRRRLFPLVDRAGARGARAFGHGALVARYAAAGAYLLSDRMSSRGSTRPTSTPLATCARAAPASLLTSRARTTAGDRPWYLPRGARYTLRAP